MIWARIPPHGLYKDGLNDRNRAQPAPDGPLAAESNLLSARRQEGAAAWGGMAVKKSVLSDRFLIGEELGRGAYGQVFKGIDAQTGDVVAIKQISLSGVSQENRVGVIGEIDLLKTLNHKNIVKYIGSFKTRTHLYIILEYMENGSLSSVIKPNRFGVFPESLVAIYIAQVLQGLAYLHDQGVVHRDIKGANILTTKEVRGVARGRSRGARGCGGAVGRWPATQKSARPSLCRPVQLGGKGAVERLSLTRCGARALSDTLTPPLVSAQGLVKLADFGVAAKLGELETGRDELQQNVVGTPYWMAPEVRACGGCRGGPTLAPLRLGGQCACNGRLEAQHVGGGGATPAGWVQGFLEQPGFWGAGARGARCSWWPPPYCAPLPPLCLLSFPGAPEQPAQRGPGRAAGRPSDCRRARPRGPRAGDRDDTGDGGVRHLVGRVPHPGAADRVSPLL